MDDSDLKEMIHFLQQRRISPVPSAQPGFTIGKDEVTLFGAAAPKSAREIAGYQNANFCIFVNGVEDPEWRQTWPTRSVIGSPVSSLCALLGKATNSCGSYFSFQSSQKMFSLMGLFRLRTWCSPLSRVPGRDPWWFFFCPRCHPWGLHTSKLLDLCSQALSSLSREGRPLVVGQACQLWPLRDINLKQLKQHCSNQL